MRTGGFTLSKKQMETHEAARTALAEARKLLPGWRAAARMLARNSSLQVHLQASGSACTDGKQVWLRVPAELAAMPPHDRSLCGIRGENKILVCEACATLEDVNITIIHEIAHMIFDTFEEVSAFEQAKLVENAIMIGAQGQPESARAAKIKARIEAMDPRERNNYLSLSNQISPFLPLLINAGEDIRVNTLMQRERPGTRVMFDAQTQRVFTDGILSFDGSRVKWSEQPANAQAMIGVYCKVGGFDWRGWLAPEIVEALDDPELDEICNKLRDAKSVRQVYRLSIPLLECLRRLGFMRDEDDPEDEPDPGEGEESDEGQDSDEAGDQSNDDSGDSGGSVSDESSGEEGASEGADDQDESDDTDSSGDSDPSGDADDHPEKADGEGEGSASDEPESGEDSASGNGRSEDSADEEAGNQPSGSDGDDADGSGEVGDDGVQDDMGQGDAGDGAGPLDGPGEPAESPPTGEQADPGASAPDPVDDDARDATESPQNDRKDTRDSGFDASSGEMGTPEEVERLMTMFGRHDEAQAAPSGGIEQSAFEDAVEKAIKQMDFFDSPSLHISGVTEHKYKDRQGAWQADPYYDHRNVSISVSEGVMSQALQRLRILFTDNARGRVERNRRSGKVDGRVLAKRAPAGDDRLFKKNVEPGRRDYFVLIGLDVSGSTSAPIERGVCRLDMMKAAAGAKAELLTRLGIPFAMYAHSGDMRAMEIFEVKGPKERWGVQQREALANLKPYSANLDGHTLEYYRKVMQRRSETDRMILYYTDGAMPAANFHEELQILQREIKICEQQGIHLIGVGCGTDSPKEHGLDTILLDDLDGVPNVITELRKRFM